MESGLSQMEQHDLEQAIGAILDQLLVDCGLTMEQAEHILISTVRRAINDVKQR